MNEKYLQLIEDLVDLSRSALRISKKCEVLAVNAAKLYASTATPGNNARGAIAFLQQAVDTRIDDEWLKKVRAFLKQATAPVA